METNNIKIVKIEISKDALDTIKEIQSKDGYNVRERQICMMEAISDLTLSLDTDDVGKSRFCNILTHLSDYEKLLRELNRVHIIGK